MDCTRPPSHCTIAQSHLGQWFSAMSRKFEATKERHLGHRTRIRRSHSCQIMPSLPVKAAGVAFGLLDGLHLLIKRSSFLALNSANVSKIQLRPSFHVPSFPADLGLSRRGFGESCPHTSDSKLNRPSRRPYAVLESMTESKISCSL